MRTLNILNLSNHSNWPGLWLDGTLH